MMNIYYILCRLINRRPASVKNSIIDKQASIGNAAQVVDSKIGRYTYVYESKIINCDIGAFCSIAADCTIGGASHPITWISTSPVFYSGRNVFGKNFSDNNFESYAKTKIGNDVWIGSKCLIKGGISIGDGAIIGMGSVVTHDVPPYEIWAGNPAKFIRKRFDDETIRHLQKIQWWDFPEEKLHCVGKYFDSPDLFINKMKKDDDL